MSQPDRIEISKFEVMKFHDLSPFCRYKLKPCGYYAEGSIIDVRTGESDSRMRSPYSYTPSICFNNDL
jgi:hypothetical protein